MTRKRRRVRRALVAILLALLAGGAGCGRAPEGEAMPTRDINAVLAEHAPAWMARDGVAGVAVGATDDGTPCLLILIAHDDDELRASLPQQVDGHPVRIEVSGEFRPY